MNKQTEDFGTIVMQLASKHRAEAQAKTRADIEAAHAESLRRMRALKPFWVALMQIQEACWRAGMFDDDILTLQFYMNGAHKEAGSLPTWEKMETVPSIFETLTWYWEGSRKQLIGANLNGTFYWQKPTLPGAYRFDGATLEEALPAFIEYWGKALSTVSSLKL